MMRDIEEQLKDVLREAKALAVRYYAITGKPLGVTGEVAEYEAAQKLGLQLAPARTALYDAYQADCDWVGDAGPGPSYGDELDGGRAGFDNDFVQRNTTIMTWNLMHLARTLKDADGLPNHGNNRKAWKAGCRFDYENPEHRV
jgi:hypothetical protein